MSSTREDTCRGCGAAIVWIRLNGRWHPCEPRRLQIIDEDSGRLVAGRESHFATCPKADNFRRKRG